MHAWSEVEGKEKDVRGKDGSERIGGEKGGGGGRRIKTEAEGITTLPCFPSRFGVNSSAALKVYLQFTEVV